MGISDISVPFCIRQSSDNESVALSTFTIALFDLTELLTKQYTVVVPGLIPVKTPEEEIVATVGSSLCHDIWFIVALEGDMLT